MKLNCMPNEDECATCGNPVGVHDALCPYCGAVERVQLGRVRVDTVDIGHVDWSVDEARRALEDALELARVARMQALIVVHGYGSTGQGGRIRTMVHKTCNAWQQRRTIRAWLPGGVFGPGNELARAVTTELPELRAGVNWGRKNPGVTVVWL